MRFKLLGLVFLGMGLYLVVHGVMMARALPEAGVAAQVYCLAAIFMAITVRVLQAERHHRTPTRPPSVRTALPPLRDPGRHIEDYDDDEILNEDVPDRPTSAPPR